MAIGIKGLLATLALTQVSIGIEEKDVFMRCRQACENRAYELVCAWVCESISSTAIGATEVFRSAITDGRRTVEKGAVPHEHDLSALRGEKLNHFGDLAIE